MLHWKGSRKWLLADLCNLTKGASAPFNLPAPSRRQQNLRNIMSEIQPPFLLGDRVDHKKFGLSTVCEPASGGPVSWKVTIQPDDPGSTPKTVVHNVDRKEMIFLNLVSSPDERGERYWRIEWEALFLDFERTTQAKNDLMRNSFRCGDHASILKKLGDLKSAVNEAEERLLEFLEEDSLGLHK